MKKNLHLFMMAFLMLGLFSTKGNAQKIFALSNNNMFYWFDASNANAMSTPMAITGLAAGSELVGMDVRPATGQVYLLGYDAMMQKAQVYTLDTTSGSLMAVGSGISPIALDGKIGFDFNPTVDRIRVVSSKKHDYRLHPVTGALVATDGMLMYAANDVNAGKNPNIGTAAYTNSYIASTATTLYNYDDSLNVLTIQNPPNNGVQNTIGSSGIMVNMMDATSDMDIYFNPLTMQNIAYFIANTGMNTTDSLYTINLSTGMATAIRSLNMELKDIAVMIDRKAPMQTGTDVWALSSNNNLVRFNTSNPSYIISAIPVTGLTAGQTLVGMDMRPVDLKVYGIGYNVTTMVARIYTINTSTGMATPVSADSISNIDLSGNVGVDFNPVADRIRVVTSNNKNYRLNQLTGLLAATDSMLKYKTGDVNFGTDPDVATAAYTNTKVGPTSTLLYVHDDALNVLLTQNPPNDGILNTIGSTGITVNAMDKTTDMDIYFDHATQMNTAYFSANAMGSNDKLYSMNLATGAASELGTIGMGIAIRDIVVQLDSTPVMSSVNNNVNVIRSVNVYPNPVQSKLTINFTIDESAAVSIVLKDITGKTISNLYNELVSFGKQEMSFDVSNIENGMYLLVVESNGEKSVKKVVISE